MTTTSKAIDTFPRNCELVKGMKRMGYSHVDRAHDAAIVEQRRRDGVLTDEAALALTKQIEGHRYSMGAFEL